MINPQPVDDRRSTYSVPSSTPSSGFRQAPTSNPAPLKPRKPRRWVKGAALTFLTLFVAVGTYAYAQYRSLRDSVIVAHEGDSSAILNFDPSDKNATLNPASFQKAGDGRFNIVVVGVNQGLTDSIQIFSLDTFNNKVGVTSLPRDLYVKNPNGGRSKINAVYNSAESKKKGSGPTAVREIVSDVLGIRVSNFALIDFTGLKDVVDALGGIDINVPTALYDPSYPADNGIDYSPLSIKAGPQKMDGATALRYSRCRKGNCGNDFGRSERQQQVIAAIKAKALTAGVLTSPVKVNGLITALGSHFKTDMQVEDIKAFLNLYQKVTSENTTGQVLETGNELGLLTSLTDPVAGYINYPVLGYDKYSAIHQWFQKNNPDPLIAKEAPSITVINSGKATAKQLQELITTLTEYGYNATLSTSTQTLKNKPTSTQIYASKPNAKPFSRNYLNSQFSTTIQSGKVFDSQTDYELVYVPTSTSASVSSPSPSPSPKR